MARKGTLPPSVKLEALLEGGTPRCQFVKAPLEGKKYGEQCKKGCVAGRPRCKYHGGLAGRPPIHHRRSKYQAVPTGLQEKFEQAMVDPELLNMWNKIALIEAQIWQIGEKASKDEEFTTQQTRKLLKLMAVQKSLVAQETIRRQALGTMLPIERVVVIMKFLYDSVSRHVPDKAVRAKIGADFRKIMSGTGVEDGAVVDATARIEASKK
jgi:hypothetical protein